jgi:hypothetical protein
MLSQAPLPASAPACLRQPATCLSQLIASTRGHLSGGADPARPCRTRTGCCSSRTLCPSRERFCRPPISALANPLWPVTGAAADAGAPRQPCGRLFSGWRVPCVQQGTGGSVVAWRLGACALASVCGRCGAQPERASVPPSLSCRAASCLRLWAWRVRTVSRHLPFLYPPPAHRSLTLLGPNPREPP